MKFPSFSVFTECSKALYPHACFGLAAFVTAIAVTGNKSLSDSRWASLMSLAGVALTAGAAIAQSPSSSVGIAGIKGSENASSVGGESKPVVVNTSANLVECDTIEK